MELNGSTSFRTAYRVSRAYIPVRNSRHNVGRNTFYPDSWHQPTARYCACCSAFCLRSTNRHQHWQIEAATPGDLIIVSPESFGGYGYPTRSNNILSRPTGIDSVTADPFQSKLSLPYPLPRMKRNKTRIVCFEESSMSDKECCGVSFY